MTIARYNNTPLFFNEGRISAVTPDSPPVEGNYREYADALNAKLKRGSLTEELRLAGELADVYHNNSAQASEMLEVYQAARIEAVDSNPELNGMLMHPDTFYECTIGITREGNRPISSFAQLDEMYAGIMIGSNEVNELRYTVSGKQYSLRTINLVTFRNRLVTNNLIPMRDVIREFAPETNEEERESKDRTIAFLELMIEKARALADEIERNPTVILKPIELSGLAEQPRKPVSLKIQQAVDLSEQLIKRAKDNKHTVIGKAIAALLLPSETEAQPVLAQRINKIFNDHFADDKSGRTPPAMLTETDGLSFAYARRRIAQSELDQATIGALGKTMVYDLFIAWQEINKMHELITAKDSSITPSHPAHKAITAWKRDLDDLTSKLGLSQTTFRVNPDTPLMMEKIIEAVKEAKQFTIQEAQQETVNAEVIPPAGITSLPAITASIAPTIAPTTPLLFEKRDCNTAYAGAQLLQEWVNQSEHTVIGDEYDERVSSIAKKATQKLIASLVKSITQQAGAIAKQPAQNQVTNYRNLRDNVYKLQTQISTIREAVEDEASGVITRWQTLLALLSESLIEIPAGTTKATFLFDAGSAEQEKERIDAVSSGQEESWLAQQEKLRTAQEVAAAIKSLNTKYKDDTTVDLPNMVTQEAAYIANFDPVWGRYSAEKAWVGRVKEAEGTLASAPPSEFLEARTWEPVPKISSLKSLEISRIITELNEYLSAPIDDTGGLKPLQLIISANLLGTNANIPDDALQSATDTIVATIMPNFASMQELNITTVTGVKQLLRTQESIQRMLEENAKNIPDGAANDHLMHIADLLGDMERMCKENLSSKPSLAK